jgi:hypothetical protein
MSDLFDVMILPDDDSIIEIGTGAFYKSELRAIKIPNSVTAIKTDAFTRCQYLSEIYYNGTMNEWNQIILSERWI